MSKITRKPPQPSKPPALPTGGGVIRPMYGIAIRNDLARFGGSINKTMGEINQALADGSLKGKEATEAKKAWGDLMKAYNDLGLEKWGTFGTPSGKTTGARDLGGVIRPMYGISIRDDLARFRDEISQTIKDINAAINNKQLTGTELTEAKKSLKDLKAALADLKPVATGLR